MIPRRGDRARYYPYVIPIRAMNVSVRNATRGKSRREFLFLVLARASISFLDPRLRRRVAGVKRGGTIFNDPTATKSGSLGVTVMLLRSRRNTREGRRDEVVETLRRILVESKENKKKTSQRGIVIIEERARSFASFCEAEIFCFLSERAKAQFSWGEGA